LITFTAILPVSGLFFIHLGSRKVFLCPATYHPNERWIKQQARNVQMWFEEQNIHVRFLLRDRDTKFTASFDELFRSIGTGIIKTPFQAPNANAYAEAWVGSLKRECLDYFLCFSLRHLDHIAQTYVTFHSQHRPHQGLGNKTLPAASGGKNLPTIAVQVGRIRCQRFLGGLLRHCYRAAA
jgi:putative transposase